MREGKKTVVEKLGRIEKGKKLVPKSKVNEDAAEKDTSSMLKDGVC